MTRFAFAVALGALGGTLLSAASASPDGAEWTAADATDGCRSCHLSDQPVLESPALQLRGLPATFAAGTDYRLTITLEDPALKNAGFLLTLRSIGTQTGTLTTATDTRVESTGTQARSTYEGSRVAMPGRAEWQLLWTAPTDPDGPVRFDLWANAGNRDLSPLDDRVYRGTWETSP